MPAHLARAIQDIDLNTLAFANKHIRPLDLTADGCVRTVRITNCHTSATTTSPTTATNDHERICNVRCLKRLRLDSVPKNRSKNEWSDKG